MLEQLDFMCLELGLLIELLSKSFWTNICFIFSSENIISLSRKKLSSFNLFEYEKFLILLSILFFNMWFFELEHELIYFVDFSVYRSKQSEFTLTLELFLN